MNICKKNRSLSPHLSAYKTQITSLISIFHRISGSVLGLALLLLPFFISLSYSFMCYSLFYYFMYLLYWIVDLFYFVFLITLVFHFMNGIRHILWDFCFGLELNNLFITGCFVLSFSFLSIVFFIIF